MGDSIDDPTNGSSSTEDNPNVLISKSELSSLSEQIALSLNKMRQLEEQIRIIPELQKQLDNIKLSPPRQEEENQVRITQHGYRINHNAPTNYRVELNQQHNAPLIQLNSHEYRGNCDSITSIPTYITNRNQSRQYRHNSNATTVKQRSQVQSVTSSNTLDSQRSSKNRLDQSYDLRKTSSPANNSLSRRETFIRSNTLRNNVLTSTKNYPSSNKPTSHRNQSNKRPINHIIISNPSTLKHTNMQTGSYQQQVKSRPRHIPLHGSNTINNNHRQNNSVSSGYTSLTRQGTYVIESNHKNFIVQHVDINDEELDSGSMESSTPTASPIQNLYNQLGNQLQKSISMPVTPVMRQGKIMMDSSTMTELTMADIITRADMQSLLNSTANSISTMPPMNRADELMKTNNFMSQTCSYSADENVTRRTDSTRRARLQSNDFDITLEPQTSSSVSPENSADIYEDARVDDEQEMQLITANHHDNQQQQQLCSKSPAVTSSNPHISHVTIRRHRKKRRDSNHDNGNVVILDNHDDHDDDDDDSSGANIDDIIAEPFSLGSSYLDPSDFDEYYSYEQDTRKNQTKDQHQNHNRNINHHQHQMKHDNNNHHNNTTKPSSEFKHAIRKLQTIMNNCPGDKSQTHSSALEMIRTLWFDIVTKSETKLGKVKSCLDYVETFNKNLTSCIINFSDKTGNSALHYAASNCRFDIIDLLIDTDVCDVNCRNKAGYTPVMLLSLIEINSQADQDITKRVFMRADVNIQSASSGQTALMLASGHGRIVAIKILLDCGANPAIRDLDGSTALMCAAENSHEDIVNCLLAHPNTDPWAADNDGLDALAIAMNNGHDRITATLYSLREKRGSKR